MYSKKFCILEQEEVIPGHRLMCLDAPEVAARAVPGQFLHVRCGDGHDPLLRRPLSIHQVNRETGRVYILYRLAGRGTSLLARLRPGDLLDIMGPLGRGYTLPEAGESVAVLGGGIGAAPLFFLLSEIKRTTGGVNKVTVFLGASSADTLPGAEQVRAMGYRLFTATNDGSEGYKGNVIELAEDVLKNKILDRVYACGPAPLLKSLSGMVAAGVRVEVSAEERMGCGVGACLSCICKVRGEGPEGYSYAHVCKDGPVFNLRDLY